MQIKNHFTAPTKTRQQEKAEEKMIENIQRKLTNRSSLTHSEVVFLMDWEIAVERLKHNSRVMDAVSQTKGIGEKTRANINENVSKMMQELPSYSLGIIEENKRKQGEQANEER